MIKKDITKYPLVEEYLTLVAGKYAPELIRICVKKKKCVTDEDIGKKLNLKITEIRTILNQLHYKGIVCYKKEKNKKTGWYSYTWEIRQDKITQQIVEKKAEEIIRLEKRIEMEGTHTMFACKKECESFPFEIAAEYYFNCPACGNPLKARDNQKETKKIKRQLIKIKSEIEEIQQAQG
ncbi:MAG: hypothetical protein ABIA76_04815 [Candidatus Diapherotrites archaeon]